MIEIGRINAGNTRGDAKFDIDGATATLMYYAKLGESLGSRRVMLDGDAIQIGGARLQGQHILTSRPGVALHINAFNFPAWGLAEKAACALLAGMPVIPAGNVNRVYDVANGPSYRRRRRSTGRRFEPRLWQRS